MVLALSGGVLGVLVAVLGTRVVGVIGAAQLPRMDELKIDRSVLLFSAVSSILAGIVFGIAPALRVSSSDASNVLRQAGRVSDGAALHRTRGLLVLTECALAIVLLSGAGLLLRSLARINSVDPGFKPAGVLTARLEYAPEPPPSGEESRMGSSIGPLRATGRVARLDAFTARVRSVPGVESVGYIDDMFVAGEGNTSITIPGHPSDAAIGELNYGDVSFGFFRTMGVPIVRGRDLAPEDVATKIHALWQVIVTDRSLEDKERLAIPEPVVVNEAFARRFFPDEDPIGKRFCTDPTNKTYWYTIVGVAGDMHRSGLEHAIIPEFFGVYLPAPNARGDLVVRTSGDPLQVAPLLRRLVATELPGTIVVSINTADRQLGDFAAQRGFQTWLLVLFATLAVALAAIGIFGVVHYSVAERTREIGVRIALGAAPADVMAMIVRQGMTMPLIGIMIGIVGSFATTRLLSHLLFGIGAADPLTFGTVITTLLGLSFLACLIPARRAAAADPLIALRAD
jgi:predicted permease